MVAGIFAVHGFWTGESYDGAGYRTYENRGVKDQIRRNKEKISHGEFCVPFLTHFAPEKEPWLWKGPIEVYPCFQHWKAVRICVRRDLDSCADAVIARHPEGDWSVARHIIQRRNYLMNQISDVDVFTDELIEGNFVSIWRALNLCGVAFDQALAESVIDRSMWHYAR